MFVCINPDFERLLAHKVWLGQRDNQTEDATLPETGISENNHNTENESEEEAPPNDEDADIYLSI